MNLVHEKNICVKIENYINDVFLVSLTNHMCNNNLKRVIAWSKSLHETSKY